MPNATPLFSAADAELTRRIGIFDAHNDYALGLLREQFRGTGDSLRSYWIPRFRAGGVNIAVTPIFTPDVYLPDGALRFAIRAIDALFREIDDNAEHVELARSYADIERINSQGKIAILLAFEGAEPLGQDLATLRLFYEVGLRMLSFTWMRRTFFADGTWENESRGGLTRLGRQAVKEMERLGIIVDVSHASDQTTWDIVDVASGPVIASHSNARAVQDHPRNLTDDMIRAIAESGGVVGVVAVTRFVTSCEPTIAKWVDHIDYIVQLVGIDHVGIGADFYRHLGQIEAALMIAEWSGEAKALGAAAPFEGMLSPEDFPGLTAELLRRGYQEDDLVKIYRGNFLRVTRQVLG